MEKKASESQKHVLQVQDVGVSELPTSGKILERTEIISSTPSNPKTDPASRIKPRKIRKFLKSFIAVNNDVNEQTVMGVLFAFVSLVLIGLHVARIGDSGIDLIVTTSTMTLSCFGIAGLKGFGGPRGGGM